MKRTLFALAVVLLCAVSLGAQAVGIDVAAVIPADLGLGAAAGIGMLPFIGDTEDELNIKQILEKGLKSLDGKIDAKLKEMDEQREKDGAMLKSTSEALKALTDQHKSLSTALQELAQKGVKLDTVTGEERKSIGENFVGSEAWKNYTGGRVKVELHKNTILGEAGSPQEPSNILVPEMRLPGIVAGAFRSLRLLDVIPFGTTESNMIQYTRELSWTNDAAETKEGATKPESDLTFELVDAPVRTIAHWIKVSKQVMEDAPALSGYIDRRLRHGVQQRLQAQIINGNGTSPNISGILDAGNYTVSTAATADTVIDFANRMKYQIINADYEADVFLMNPTDWGTLERKKRTDNGYIAGDGGAVAYINNGTQMLLWGLPVIVHPAVPAGTLVCMSLAAVMGWQRKGVIVEVFEQDGTNVQANLLTVRAEMRAAFSVFTPAAIRAGTIPA